MMAMVASPASSGAAKLSWYLLPAGQWLRGSHGNGAVTAAVQIKGRIDPRAALENIGDPISLSGNATPSVPVSSSVVLSALGAAELYADLTACSLVSFRAVAWEAL